MAKPDTSIDPRLLESAKREFLIHGFERASLKTICENADITTGALYNRFNGKEDLFCAIVEPTVLALKRFVANKTAVNVKVMSDRELIDAWDMDYMVMEDYFRFLYGHYDGFRLLVKSAAGTRYENFQHDWVELMMDENYKWYLEAKRRGLTHGDVEISRQYLHVLLSSFWTTIFEPFIHDFSWEQMQEHCKLLCGFFNWKKSMAFVE